VQNNDLAEVSGLEEISALDTLNISNNRIACLSNLACCPLLRTLICTSNKLDSVESIQHLAECKGLQTLDLQNNDIADPAGGAGAACGLGQACVWGWGWVRPACGPPQSSRPSRAAAEVAA